MENCSTTKAFSHIQKIRTQKFYIGKKEANPLTQDLHHAVTSLSAELYGKDVHFIMELIQNAEDNEYKEGVEPTLEFVLTKKDITGTGAPATLLVFNNEIGFSQKNIDSICSVGRSTKKGKRQQGFIGEKGIGFKSVFLVSSQPHIFSNGYRVRFNEEPDQYCGIGYVVPEWVSEKPYLSSICDVYGVDKVLPTTMFILPLKPEKVEAVREQLSKLHPELLLFLSKIKCLYVCGCDPEGAQSVSIVSICSQTDDKDLRGKTAKSHVVQLSVKESMCDNQELCKYYLWREAFPVKPGNRVGIRSDVEKWVVTLAFPFGERLRRGTSCIGVFAFLPTAMVTNFPFVIQADFILASSRECVLLDNVWNMGILECVPTAFVNALESCIRQLSLFPSVGQVFEFLPAQASVIPVFNNLRQCIKTRLQGLKIVPHERFSDNSSTFFFSQPQHAVRILPRFRDILVQMESKMALLIGLYSLKNVLHSSLDLEKYSAALDFLGVPFADDQWYTKCIKSSNLVLHVSDDVYVDLLGFIADNETIFSSEYFKSIPLLKYIDQEGNLKICSVTKTTTEVPKIRYAVELETHTWLSKCSLLFGCPDTLYFLPNSTQKALLNRSSDETKKNHRRSSSICSWLSYQAGVKACTTYDYALLLCSHVLNKEPNFAVEVVSFLYHAHRKCFLDDNNIYNLCRNIPVIDGDGHVRTRRTIALVPASGSKWMKLFGPRNPFVGQGYVDIGDVYAKSSLFLGDSVREKELLCFVCKYCKAVDLLELCPPDVVLQIASSELSSEQAFLLLDWIRLLRTKGSYIPTKFIESIRNGKWMKTYLGYISPRQAILPDETGKSIFDMMKHVLVDISILDQEFYKNRISSYQDELKFLGVGLASNDVGRLVSNRFESFASPGMNKECTFSLLSFISFSRHRNMIDEDWLAVMKEKKWLKTLQGYDAPKGSILLQSAIEAETCLKITNLPVVDEAFYGGELGSFLSELRQLGVESDTVEVQKVIAANVTLTANLSSLTSDCGLLILKCIKCLGSEASDLIKRITCKPWIKTAFGLRCPSETILPDPQWGSLLSVLQMPAIDEMYYRNEIRHFSEELKAVGVVDNATATEMIAAQFSSLLSSSNWLPANVMSLLGCIRELSQTMSLHHPELKWLLCEKWLRTRHGYKTPCESIIFSSQWGSISLFVDLPLIDDVYYGIGIYKYRDELEKLGVITDFEGGAVIVAKGLSSPIEDELITADGILSLLECLKCLMTRSPDEPSLSNFLKNIAKSKCLKTQNGYKLPEECVLFDPAWEGILKPSDAPTIDENFYRTDISVYKNQLRDIGVKVDSLDVCSLLSGILFSLTETTSITRIYSFLNKFQWNPEVLDNLKSQVWIPTPKGTGKWINSQNCVLHDNKHVFGSRLFSLDKFYKKELLPLFSSAFGVAENPTTNDYLELWNSWAMRVNYQVTLLECSSFWEHVVDNWNQELEVTLKQQLTKLPALMSMSRGIYLINREEVFIADDMQLKTIFTSFDKVPLFVWFPRSDCLPISPIRLQEIYDSLGVRKLSESVECKVPHIVSLKGWEKVDPRAKLIQKGLIRIVLGFLARPQINMSSNQRHKAAKSLLELSVYKSDKQIHVCYRLMPSASTTIEVEKIKLVLWEKNLQRLLVDKSGYEDGKADLEFVTSFSDELAQGLLAQGTAAAAADSLSKIIQMGFMFDFNESKVEFLLMRENLELLEEDMNFLDAFLKSEEPATKSRKRLYKKLDQLGTPTPITSCKKHCQ